MAQRGRLTVQYSTGIGDNVPIPQSPASQGLMRVPIGLIRFAAKSMAHKAHKWRASTKKAAYSAQTAIARQEPYTLPSVRMQGTPVIHLFTSVSAGIISM